MRRNSFSMTLLIKVIQYLVYILIGVTLFGTLNLVQAASSSGISYRVYPQANSIVHVVKVAANSDRIVTTKTATNLQPLNFFLKGKEVAAINGGYFDPNNQQTTSFVTTNKRLVADPRLNSRLVDNPDLAIYLGKILNRAEFRRYQCDGQNVYDITLHRQSVPAQCVLIDALGAGPQLLPVDTSQAEGFTAYQDGKLIRNAIGVNTANARSAVGITKDGTVILAMVEQKDARDSGLSLADLALFLKNLGVTKAMNLDGGSSTSLYYRGRTYYGKLNPEGNKVKRPLKSILVVQEN